MADLEKTRMGNDAVKLTASKIATMLIGLISSMLLSRFRTLTEYGTYSQILMAVNLVCSLLMLGLPNSINYFLAKAKTKEERDRFLSVYYTLNTLLSLLTGLILVLSIPLLEMFFKNEWIRGFWYFLALYPWTKIIMSSIEHLLVVYKKTSMLLVYRLLNSMALLATILVVQLCGGSFMLYMVLFLAVEILFTVWTYVIVRQNTDRFQFGFDKKLMRTIFTFSIPIGLASMVGTINIELDKMVITSFLSTEDLAVYTNASRELPVTVIATSLTAVLLPQMVRLLQKDKKEEAVALWNNATTISFAIISLIAVGCIIFAPEVITILYSEKYLDGVWVFRIYCLTLLLKCTYFGMLLNATGNTKVILYSSIGSLVLNVVLNYICFYVLGFVGPAVATLLSSVAMQIFQLLYTCRKVDVRFSKIFPWKNCGIYLVLNIGLGCVFYFVKDWICKTVDINHVVIAICLGCVWAVTFVLIAFRPLMKQWRCLNKET